MRVGIGARPHRVSTGGSGPALAVGVELFDLRAQLVPCRPVVGVADLVAQLTDTVSVGIVGLPQVLEGVATALQQLLLRLTVTGRGLVDQTEITSPLLLRSPAATASVRVAAHGADGEKHEADDECPLEALDEEAYATEDHGQHEDEYDESHVVLCTR